MKKLIILICIFLAASGAVQAAHAGASDDRDVFKERVVLYWEARKKGDWETIKTLVDPEIRGGITAYLDSLKSQPSASEVLSYRIKGIEIAGDNAVVVSKIKIRLAHPLLGSPRLLRQVLRDKWIKRNGLWHIIIVRPDLKKMMEQQTGDKK